MNKAPNLNETNIDEEFQKLNSLLEESNDELYKLKTVKIEILAFLTHMLKTPLTNISAFQLLNRSKLSDEEKDIYDIVEHGYQEMKYIIDRAIEYFTVFAKPPNIYPERIDFMTLIGDIILSSRNKFKENNISYLINIKQNSFFETDINIISKIIDIITDNAIKFNKQNGNIIYSCHDLNEKVKIVIEDTGCGIGVTPIDNIFSLLNIHGLKFHAHGTGLNLPIAKNLIRFLNGELHAENRANIEGASFTIELPKIYTKSAI